MTQRRIYALCMGTFLIGVLVSSLVSMLMVNGVAHATAQDNPHTLLCPNCSLGGDPGENHKLRGYDYRNAYMPFLNVGRINFDDMDFSGADFYSCNAVGMTARSSRFVGTYLGSCLVSRDDFSHANFSHANLFEAHLADVNFTGANFTSANLSNQRGSTSFWQTANFTGANFTNANLSGVQNKGGLVFTGAIWANTICPDGTNSDADGGTCMGHF